MGEPIEKSTIETPTFLLCTTAIAEPVSALVADELWKRSEIVVEIRENDLFLEMSGPGFPCNAPAYRARSGALARLRKSG